MRDSIPELKNTNNNYYKIGFATFYIKTLIVNQKYDKAVEYATSYFEAYKKKFSSTAGIYFSALICRRWYKQRNMPKYCRLHADTNWSLKRNSASTVPIICQLSSSTPFCLNIWKILSPKKN